jgi:hypothetical protein
MQKKNMLIRMDWVEEYNKNYMWIEYTSLNNLIHKTIQKWFPEASHDLNVNWQKHHIASSQFAKFRISLYWYIMTDQI